MSTIIKFDYKELKRLANDSQSCIVEKTVTQNLAIKPWSLGNLKESIKNLLDYKIGKFVKELNGILISFKNLRVLQNVGAIKNDNSDVIFQVQADYYIFQPYVGAILTGIVSKKTVTHLVVLLNRVFNVMITRPTEDHGNSWYGLHIQENQEVTFKVVVLDMYGALPYIRGELDERWNKHGQGGVDEAVEPAQTKLTKAIEVSYQRQNSEKPVTFAKNGHNKVSTKNNVSIHNNSIYQNQSDDEIEVNLHTIKNKNKRHKDHVQKYCDSDIKQIEPKFKYIKHMQG